MVNIGRHLSSVSLIQILQTIHTKYVDSSIIKAISSSLGKKEVEESKIFSKYPSTILLTHWSYLLSLLGRENGGRFEGDSATSIGDCFRWG